VSPSVTPEQLARERIDALLAAAGWTLQSKDGFNRTAAEGIAVREFVLPNGPCDYLLFVGGKAAGVIEAKKAGATLSGVAEQSLKYVVKLPDHLARWSDQLIFHYESTGEETFFRDTRDPHSRSRRMFAFQKPHTLHAWLKEEDTLRRRLQEIPTLDKSGLRDCQVDAIHGLDASLAKIIRGL
jgi:type I restriction enzyme R subunit